MSTPNEMLDATNCVETIFLKIVNLRESINVFLLYEGIDDHSYYYQSLKSYLTSKTYIPFDCDGKDGVLELHKKLCISKDIELKNDTKLLFFIDNDYNKTKIYPKEIYVTPCYSIENHYFSDSAFEAILSGAFKMKRLTDSEERDFQKALNYLKSERERVIKEVKYVNAWISLQVQKRENSPLLQYSLKQLKEYNKIKGLSTCIDIENKVPTCEHITDDELKNELQYFDKDPINLIRGKYFEQAMTSSFCFLITNLNKKDSTFFKNKRNVHFTIGEDSLITVFAAYADVPENLNTYIKNIFN